MNKILCGLVLIVTLLAGLCSAEPGNGKLSPGDKDALQCKVVLQVELGSFEPALKLIAASPAGAPVAIKPVLGRWQRTDGDYTLAIIGGENGGILQAQYFNPKSINVSRAAWIDSGGRLQVLVELNDVGYPGATYVLHLDTTTDRLVGQYKQPAQQQTYDIEFTRQAPSPLK
jgi:hypothetical protein